MKYVRKAQKASQPNTREVYKGKPRKKKFSWNKRTGSLVPCAESVKTSTSIVLLRAQKPYSRFNVISNKLKIPSHTLADQLTLNNHKSLAGLKQHQQSLSRKFWGHLTMKKKW